MRNIVYLNNYITDNILSERKNNNFFSQAANNKIQGIAEAFSSVSAKTTILSSGLVNNKTGILYPEKKEYVNDTKIITCKIKDLPGINTISSAFYMYKKIKELHAEKKVDNIIFYNFKPEVAWAACAAKVFLNIPMTVEYEDGYIDVHNVKGIKRKIFLFTERYVSKKIHSAILVSSQLSEKFSQPSVVVRGVVNQNFYDKCKKYRKTPNSKFTILYSGGLGPARGIDVLLKALDYLDIECTVQITGKGTLEYDDRRIDFKGFLEYGEVQKLMLQADLLVQCQLAKESFARASFPSKLFEYIATGNMIVSSKMNEIWAFAGNKFIYYDEDSPKALAEAIKKAYKRRDMISSDINALCDDNLPIAVGKRIISIL